MNSQFITYNLFLDDVREPQYCSMFEGDNRYHELKWVVVRSHKDFMQTIIDRFNQGQFPSLVSFGYELSWLPTKLVKNSDGLLQVVLADTNEPFPVRLGTGLDSVIFLKEWCKENSLELPECLVHSTHIWGRDQILEEINSAKTTYIGDLNNA